MFEKYRNFSENLKYNNDNLLMTVFSTDRDVLLLQFN